SAAGTATADAAPSPPRGPRHPVQRAAPPTSRTGTSRREGMRIGRRASSCCGYVPSHSSGIGQQTAMNAERSAHAIGGGGHCKMRVSRDVAGGMHTADGRLLAAIHLDVAVAIVRAPELVGDIAAGARPCIEEERIDHDRWA